MQSNCLKGNWVKKHHELYVYRHYARHRIYQFENVNQTKEAESANKQTIAIGLYISTAFEMLRSIHTRQVAFYTASITVETFYNLVYIICTLYTEKMQIISRDCLSSVILTIRNDINFHWNVGVTSRASRTTHFKTIAVTNSPLLLQLRYFYIMRPNQTLHGPNQIYYKLRVDFQCCAFSTYVYVRSAQNA